MDKKEKKKGRPFGADAPTVKAIEIWKDVVARRVPYRAPKAIAAEVGISLSTLTRAIHRYELPTHKDFSYSVFENHSRSRKAADIYMKAAKTLQQLSEEFDVSKQSISEVVTKSKGVSGHVIRGLRADKQAFDEFCKALIYVKMMNKGNVPWLSISEIIRKFEIKKGDKFREVCSNTF